MPLTQWLLLNVPSWLLGFIITAIATILSVSGLLVVRKFISHEKLKVHHDVASALFNILGMAYTVLLAFVVVIVWQAFDKSNINVEREANRLADLYRDSQCFSEPLKGQVRILVKGYAETVADDEWKTIAAGNPSPRVQEILDKLSMLYISYLPKTATEQVFFEESVRNLNELCELRRERLVDSKTAIHPMFWFILIVGGIITIVFTFFFGSENFLAQITMTILLAVLISLILFTILLFDLPFTGDIKILPNAFQQMLGY